MPPAPTPDWDALTAEATELLSEYVRVDTVNPPGNEWRACEWLGAILDREGVPYQVCDPGGGRASLVASLPGDGSRGKALVLLNHTDVVPFEPDSWTADPLGGEVRDGFVWGRGTTDMKGMGILELLVLLLHRRLELPLRRELRFIAVADEEAGSAQGMEYLAREHPEVLDCAFAINEGGRGSTEALGVERAVMHIGVAEKAPLWLRLRTFGRPGHGSVPTADNAAERLVRALQRVQEWERPTVPSETMRAYAQGLQDAGVAPREPVEALLERIAHDNPRMRSLQTNTISLTTLDAGVKHNVIPAEASATLDCRLLPGEDPDEFTRALREVIDDDAVLVEEVLRSSGPTSPVDTELYAAMTRAVREVVEDAVVVPWLGAGFTDSRVFRRLGVPAYGFIPVLVPPEEQGLAHSSDERISIESLRLGLQILFATVRGVCA